MAGQGSPQAGQDSPQEHRASTQNPPLCPPRNGHTTPISRGEDHTAPEGEDKQNMKAKDLHSQCFGYAASCMHCTVSRKLAKSQAILCNCGCHPCHKCYARTVYSSGVNSHSITYSVYR